jgi:small-conductance mechanosensitive channel
MSYTPLMVALLAVNAIGILGIIIWHLQGRQRPTARLIVQIIIFLIMSGVLIASGIPPHRVVAGETVGMQSYLGTSARILWWIHLAWAVIGFVRLYIVLDHRPREARLIQDLIVAVVYLGVTLSIIGFVFGAPIGTLVATSGVVAIILGLALQNTLGDLFSGIALSLGRPFTIGDWILLADLTEGRVIQTNWRSTQLLTSANNIVVLPNSVLAKVGLTNLTRPDEAHLVALPMCIATSQPLPEAEELIVEAMKACPHVVPQPQPVVAIKRIDALSIDVELQFRVAGPSTRTIARNEVIQAVQALVLSERLRLSSSAQSLLLVGHADAGHLPARGWIAPPGHS